MSITLLVLSAQVLQSETITWKGCSWTVKSAESSGPGPIQWNPANVFVDTNGCLHLKISYNSDSGKWDCAELYTTDDLGFGAYQWQVETRVDAYDPWVVLGLFPYDGPDGNNEIDIEYGVWGKIGGDNLGWTVYPNSGTNIAHLSCPFSLNGPTTSRLNWSKNGIQYWLMGGCQPVGMTNNLIKSWNYFPDNPSENIPQNGMPLHMNLWLCRKHIAPADGKPVEVIIRDFKFVPNK